MSDKSVLTKEFAEQYCRDGFPADLSEFNAIEDAAAEILVKHGGKSLNGLDLNLEGLTSLSDEAAESLSCFKGNLCLDGLKTLSDAAAKSLSMLRGNLYLDGLTSLTDEAARSLSKHQDELFLNGVTHLSDEVARSLRNKRGEVTLHMEFKVTRVLTKDIAEQYLENNESVDLLEFTSLDSGEAAEVLAKCGGLEFAISSLDEETARGLSGHKETLYFYPPGFQASKQVAMELGKHTEHLALNFDCSALSAASLEQLRNVKALELGTYEYDWSISKEQAAALSNHVGALGIYGVQDISSGAAKHLSLHSGELTVQPLERLSVEAADILSQSKCELDIGLDEIPAESAELLKRHHSFS